MYRARSPLPEQVQVASRSVLVAAVAMVATQVPPIAPLMVMSRHPAMMRAVLLFSLLAAVAAMVPSIFPAWLVYLATAPVQPASVSVVPAVQAEQVLLLQTI